MLDTASTKGMVRLLGDSESCSVSSGRSALLLLPSDKIAHVNKQENTISESRGGNGE